MTRCLPALFSILAIVAASRAVARASASGPGAMARRPCVALTTRGAGPSAAAGFLRAAFFASAFFAAFFFVAALVDAREVATVPSSVDAPQRRFEHQVLDFVEPHAALRRCQR